jgi:hypothetical protein
MTTTTHTHGPWSVRHFKAYNTPHSEVVSANGSRVPYCDADNRLIAAAPDLLAALMEVTADIEAYCDDHSSSNPTDVTVCLPRLRAAIAKATGELK